MSITLEGVVIVGVKKPPTCVDCQISGLFRGLLMAGLRCPYSMRIIPNSEFNKRSGVIDGCPIMDMTQSFVRAKEQEELMKGVRAVHVDLDESLARELEKEKEETDDV